MQILKAELNSKTIDLLQKTIKEIHKQENKELAELQTAIERECSITTLWNNAVQYIETYSIEMIEKKLENEKCQNDKTTEFKGEKDGK